MPIQHAVLALLADGPSHGYQLRLAFTHAVGPQWGGLNIGHLYQVLERLTRDGQVSSTIVTQSQRPDRKVYELTKAGRDELARWLTEPAEHSAGYRDDLVLKLMAAARQGKTDVIGVARRQRSYELSRLKALDQLRRNPEQSPLTALLLDAAILHTRADIELTDRAEQQAAALVESVTSEQSGQRNDDQEANPADPETSATA